MLRKFFETLLTCLLISTGIESALAKGPQQNIPPKKQSFEIYYLLPDSKDPLLGQKRAKAITYQDGDSLEGLTLADLQDIIEKIKMYRPQKTPARWKLLEPLEKRKIFLRESGQEEVDGSLYENTLGRSRQLEIINENRAKAAAQAKANAVPQTGSSNNSREPSKNRVIELPKGIQVTADRSGEVRSMTEKFIDRITGLIKPKKKCERCGEEVGVIGSDYDKPPEIPKFSTSEKPLDFSNVTCGPNKGRRDLPPVPKANSPSPAKRGKAEKNEGSRKTKRHRGSKSKHKGNHKATKVAYNGEGRAPASKKSMPLLKQKSFISSKDNSYLERTLQSLPASETSFKPLVPGNLPHSCVIEAQKIFPNNHSYAKCDSKKGAPDFDYYVQPCISEKYHNLVYNAFVDVMNCLNIPQHTIFPLLTHESGFHVNAYNSGMAAGLGQLTAAAITEVNSIYFNKTHHGKGTSHVTSDLLNPETSEHTQNGDQAACKRVSRRFDHPISESKQNRCEAIAIPENPTKNFVYLGLYFAMSKKKIGEYVNNPDNTDSGHKSIAETMAENGIKGRDWENLLNKMAVQSFNAGPLTPPLALRTFLYSKGYKVKRADFDFTRLIPGNFVDFEARHLPRQLRGGERGEARAGRKREVSTYLREMLTTTRNIEAKLEGENGIEFQEPGASEKGITRQCIDPSLY